MKICILGANGLIGSTLFRRLMLKPFVDVTGVVRSTANLSNLRNMPAEFIVCNVEYSLRTS